MVQTGAMSQDKYESYFYSDSGDKHMLHQRQQFQRRTPLIAKMVHNSNPEEVFNPMKKKKRRRIFIRFRS
jgi:hypothetical protein